MNSNNSKQVEEFYLPETQEVVDFFNNRGNVADVFNVDKKEIKEAINKARQLFYLFVHQNHLNGKEKSPTGEDNKLCCNNLFATRNYKRFCLKSFYSRIKYEHRMQTGACIAYRLAL